MANANAALANANTTFGSNTIALTAGTVPVFNVATGATGIENARRMAAAAAAEEARAQVVSGADQSG